MEMLIGQDKGRETTHQLPDSNFGRLIQIIAT